MEANDTTERTDHGDAKQRIIVGIGASAGSLAALQSLFSTMPATTGASFVVVVHLAPDHDSYLSDLLQAHASMPVQQISETTELEPNRIYVIPPAANIEAIDTHVRLSPLERKSGDRAQVDHFFHTLARTHDGSSIGVILTGTGSDGARGIKSIKEHDGITIVQDPAEAEYDGMPQSAIATGVVDLILPLAEIAEAIERFTKVKPRLGALGADSPAVDAPENLHRIFTVIRAKTGRDFSRYKRSTIARRIMRRMQLHQIEELADYLSYLKREPDEARVLADDLLITVTHFFRDGEVFELLEQDVIPKLFDELDPGHGIRAWSVGCSTGEEVYSLVILLLEEANRRGVAPDFHIFASDLHEASLSRAREGYYAGRIEEEVGEQRLNRYFSPANGGYRLRKEVREHVVFAPHNLLADPPFSRLDLILCRNVLIYLERSVQKQVFELFHYALEPGGMLLLGTSETVDGAELFLAKDKQRSLYQKRNVPGPEPRLPVFPLANVGRTHPFDDSSRRQPAIPYGVMHQRIVERFAPPSVLVSPDDHIVHISEHAGRYLTHPGGEVTSSVFQLLREELRIELRGVMHTVREKNRPADSQPVPVQFGTELRPVVLHARPSLDSNESGFVLIIFDERSPIDPLDLDPDPEAPGVDSREAELIRQLRNDLATARQRLQEIVQEYEASQEEMKASNEELQSTNEELRSTMEELETSKEELQSMNEELQTVNQENRHKVDELAQLSGDLQNLLSSTDIATLFLDRDLRIMRFTPKASELFNARSADRGRPISELTNRLRYDELIDDAHRVLKDLIPIEREVSDELGHWHLSRVLPYRSTADKIAGIVLTFVDITRGKKNESELIEARQRFELALEAAGGGAFEMAIPPAPGRLHAEQWAAILGFSGDQLPPLEDFFDWLCGRLHEDDREAVEREHDAFLAGAREEYHGQLRIRHARGHWVWVQQCTRALERNEDGSVRRLVGVMLDISEAKEAEFALREREERFQAMTDDLPLIVWLHDADGEQEFVNRTFAEFFDLRRGDPHRPNWHVVVHPDDHHYIAEFEACLRDQRPFHAEARVRRGDGEWRSLESWGRPRFDAEGRFLGIVGTSADVTDRRRVEQSLREKTRQLQEEDHKKGRFLATLGHEIRNPLAAIDTAVRVLDLQRESWDELLPMIIAHVEQLTMLVNDLLEVSRISQGKIPLRKQPIDLVQVVRHASASIERRVEQKHQQFVQDLPDRLVIDGDETRLEQVVANILTNASKYTPNRGRIEIALESRDNMAVLTVRDDGVGLEPDAQVSIFEPFIQVDPRHEGLGIGLALVKNLVEMHGGRVSVASEGRGHGATFTVELPIGDVSEHFVTNRGDPYESHKLPASFRILIVDDESKSADLLGVLLRSSGAATRCAYTGESALEIWREWRPDIVLLDIGLPDKSGFDVAKELRAEETAPTTLLIALTGFGDPATEQRVLESGFDERFVKPIDHERLHDVLRRHLEQSDA
ncbi:MAG: chemotaxis protein CheB [Planctomycetota bacterium]